jgi:hypothetical protein
MSGDWCNGWMPKVFPNWCRSTCNYFLQDCSMKKPMDLALTQPCIFYKGSFNVGAGGCNIDDNSKLLKDLKS